MSKQTIPNKLNLFITLLATTSVLTILYFASHTHSTLLLVVLAIIFSFINNTVFSLLHEAVHGILNKNRTVNDLLGVYLAAFFPTGFTFQRFCHLGHHKRNRTQAEQFDYLRETDNKVLRTIQWYGILTGFYWLLAPISTLLYLIAPKFICHKLANFMGENTVHNTGTDAMLESIQKAPLLKSRLEILYTILFQFAIIYLLDITWQAWLICYAAFAINWSSLQYADHAYSKLDNIEGAWNLKINPLVRIVFLNYHHHLAHHQHPTVPWLYLSDYIDDKQPQPWFRKIYGLMWQGPRKIQKHEIMYQKVLKECC